MSDSDNPTPDLSFVDAYVKGMKAIADSKPDLYIPDDLKITIYRLAEANKVPPQEQLRTMLQDASNAISREAFANALLKNATEGSKFPELDAITTIDLPRYGIDTLSTETKT